MVFIITNIIELITFYFTILLFQCTPQVGGIQIFLDIITEVCIDSEKSSIWFCVHSVCILEACRTIIRASPSSAFFSGKTVQWNTLFVPQYWLDISATCLFTNSISKLPGRTVILQKQRKIQQHNSYFQSNYNVLSGSENNHFNFCIVIDKLSYNLEQECPKD